MESFILLLNILFSGFALGSYFCFLSGKRTMFLLGLFNNIYWLIIGCYYGWYGNITATLYFMFINYVEYTNWGKAKLINKRKIWPFLALAMVITFYINYKVGFNGIAAYINFINVSLYTITYTLRIWPKYKKVCIYLYTVNQILYLPNVLFAKPILWACVIRQIFMLYANMLTLINQNNWIVRIINKLKIS